MQDDHAERLLTHFVNGAWRVPLGSRALPVAGPDGRRAGTLVLAEPADIARAVAAAAAALPGWAADAGARRAALARLADRAADRLPDLPGSDAVLGARVRRIIGRVAARPPFPAAAVAALAGPGDAPVALAIATLAELAAGGTLVVLVTPPGRAAAHDLARIAQEADLPPGVLNLLPGDAAAVAALARHPGIARLRRTG